MKFEWKRKRIGGLKGLVQREGSLLISRGGRRRILLGSHTHSGVLSDGKKGGRMLGFWVSLGDGFGRIWRMGRGSEGRRKLLISEGRRRRILLALTLSLVLSSIGKRWWKDAATLGFNRGGTGATRVGIFAIPPVPKQLQLMERGGRRSDGQ